MTSKTQSDALNHILKADETQFSMFVQNVRGLGGKHKKFFCSSSSYDYGIIILTEKWLKDSFFDAEYFDDSFSVYRKHRLIRRGGGVLIGLNNSLFDSEQIIIDCKNDLEYVCIKAKIKSQVIYIYCAYITPNFAPAIYESHLNAINSISTNPEDLVIATGDFNLPKVQWINDSEDDAVLLPTVLTPPFTADFINGLMSRGLYQVNSIRNQNGRLILPTLR